MCAIGWITLGAWLPECYVESLVRSDVAAARIAQAACKTLTAARGKVGAADHASEAFCSSRTESTIATADMFSIERTVADVVTMWAGRAVPNNIGPMATDLVTDRNNVNAMCAASRVGMIGDWPAPSGANSENCPLG